MSTSIHLHVVDGTAALFRAHHGAPERRAPDGREVGAAVGLAQTLWRLVRARQPTHVAVVFDSPGPGLRHRIDPGYKADRPPHPAALEAQRDLAREVVSRLGLVSFSSPGVEADDLIATLAVRARRVKARVTLISPDKDVLTLRCPGIAVLDPKTLEEIGDADVRARFGVDPGRLFDFFCLVGDKTDNVQGVPGFGPRRAAELLEAHGNLDAALAAIAAGPCEHDSGLRRLARALADDPRVVERSRALIRLYAASPLDPEPRSLSELRRRRPAAGAAEFFESLGDRYLAEHLRPLVAAR